MKDQGRPIREKSYRTPWKNVFIPLSVKTNKNSRTLVNIYTCEEAGEDVNVNKAVEIGQKQMVEFCTSVPQGFRETLSTKFVTMAKSKKTKRR